MTAALLLAAACGAAPLTVADDAGTTVSLPSAARRVVSLSPGATEIVFALGAGSRVVGTCSACDYPQAAKACPKVGDFSTISAEALVARRPDLVIATGGAQRELAVRLKALGVPAVVLSPASVDGVLGNILTLGRLLGRDAAAKALTARLKERLAALTREAAARSHGVRPKVYFELWGDPLMGVGERSYTGELLRLAGAANVCAGYAEEYPRVSAERVIAGDPDVILLGWGDAGASPLARVKARAGWDGVAAVRAGRVRNRLDMDTLLRPGPRLADGLAQLVDALYPK